MIQNFIPSRIDPNEHWFMGDNCLTPAPLFPDGHGWGEYIPEGERQNKNNFESNNCTNYSLLNCVESLGRKKFGLEFQNNNSERERGIRSGTGLGGNTYQNVCECFRLQGTIPETFLPFNDLINTWDKYYSPKVMTYPLWAQAESFKKKYKYNHDWAFLPGDSLETKRLKMKEALRYSPLSVAGYAWSRHSDGLYYNDGPANHAFDIFDYVDNGYWLALDSYPDENGSFVKKISWDYNFTECKRHALERNVGSDIETEPTYTDYIKYLVGSYIKSYLWEIWK